MTKPRPVAFTTDDGLTLSGAASGPEDGPPVLLLHGGGQTRHAWSGAAARLAGEGYQAISYDARGHGDSGWSATGDYSIPVFARDLVTVLRTLGRPAALVGASLGGTSSLLAAADHPELVRAIALVDIVPDFAASGVQRIREFMRGKPEGFADLDEAVAAVRAYNPNRAGGNPEGLMRNLRTGDDGRLRWHWDPRVVDFSPDAEITRLLAACLDVLLDSLPLLLVAGANSDVVDAEAMETFRRRAPQAEIAVVSRAGHMVAGDRNDAFGEAILAFLDRALDDEGPRPRAPLHRPS